MKLGWVGWNGREVAPLALPTPSYPLCLTYAHIAMSVFLTCTQLSSEAGLRYGGLLSAPGEGRACVTYGPGCRRPSSLTVKAARRPGPQVCMQPLTPTDPSPDNPAPPLTSLPPLLTLSGCSRTIWKCVSFVNVATDNPTL